MKAYPLSQEVNPTRANLTPTQDLLGTLGALTGRYACVDDTVYVSDKSFHDQLLAHVMSPDQSPHSKMYYRQIQPQEFDGDVVPWIVQYSPKRHPVDTHGRNYVLEFNDSDSVNGLTVTTRHMVVPNTGVSFHTVGAEIDKTLTRPLQDVTEVTDFIINSLMKTYNPQKKERLTGRAEAVAENLLYGHQEPLSDSPLAERKARIIVILRETATNAVKRRLTRRLSEL